MINVLAVTPNATSSDIQCMEMTTFDHALKLFTRPKDKEVLLHANPANKHPNLKNMAERLIANGFRVTVYIDYASRNILSDMNINFLYDYRTPNRKLEKLSTTDNSQYIKPDCTHDLNHEGIFWAMPSANVSTEKLMQLIDSMPNIDYILIGVGWKQWTTGPEPIDKEQYPAWADKLIEIASVLTDKKIKTCFTCGLPLCLFSTEQIGRLARLKIKWPIAWCLHQYFITPKGQVKYCFRINNRSPLNLMELQTPAPIDHHFDYLLPVKSMCDKAKDLRCRSLITQACGGNCFAHSLAAWQGTNFP